MQKIRVLGLITLTAFMLLWHLYLIPADLPNPNKVLFIALSASLWTMYVLSLTNRKPIQKVPPGIRIGLVPCYQEAPEVVRQVVQSMMNSTVSLDRIYVIDDGSTEPVTRNSVGISDPRVIFISQENSGKRIAQHSALTYELEHYGKPDFVVTVDSDSRVHPDAIERMMWHFNRNRIHAVTGFVSVANRNENWLTRTTDLEMGFGCLFTRKARSAFGVVAPTAGTLSIYRAQLFYDNLEDYVNSGTAGDDRRMTHYSLTTNARRTGKRGLVIAEDTAVVDTDMPTTIKGMYRQRTRWFKSYWRYAMWELEHLPEGAKAMRVWTMWLNLLFPVIVLVAIVLPFLAGNTPAYHGLIYWFVLMYLFTFRYVTDRPVVPVKDRITTWLFYTPLVMLQQLTIMRPAMYTAMFQARTTHWHTRSATMKGQADDRTISAGNATETHSASAA